MRNLAAIISFFLLLIITYFSFYSLMPTKGTLASTPATEFSTERARVHLQEITKTPHYYGSEAHASVREYLQAQLTIIGLETEIQEGYVAESTYSEFDEGDTLISKPSGMHLIKPKNIIGRIKGTDDGKALLLLSHYDSAMVPSYGASDAGSGVVTILESLRAYLANGATPKNDIIVLFSDAEEIGLDGATLFVKEHPWAKDVGLVLNFEARGSGGPSNMILESNQGNANLIKNFIAANPEYPVASSLMYSIYKMLPNDTDSTVFREEGDIDSFFFAFIDDHFDYHTANDTFENLDDETLQHQGSYLLPLLAYFGDADLETLKAEEDYVYVNAPFVKMISYPFSWILWMLVIATILFIVLLFYGFSNGKLKGRLVGRGFASFFIALTVSGLIGFFGWKLIQTIYPQYAEIQQGFTYNGHRYIAFFVLLTLAILFKIYKNFTRKESHASMYVAPLLFWLLVNVAVFIILKGAGYFVIPVFFGLLAFWVLLKFESPSLLFLTLLSAPAIFLFAPLIQFFPVGLGLEMLVISCVFTVLTFGLVWPILGYFKWKNILSAICFIAAIGFFVSAHFKSDFSETRQKPNSLVYYQNADTGKSYWLTYDKMLDDWTKGYLGDNPESADTYVTNSAGSKYNSGYRYAAEAPAIAINPFEVTLNNDSVLAGKRNVSFTIYPKRTINRLYLYTDAATQFDEISFNGNLAEIPKNAKNFVNERFHNGLVRFHVAKNDSLVVRYVTDSINAPDQFQVLEYSYDLMTHPKFAIAKRPKGMMPKPFVITDAVVVNRSFSVSQLKEIKQDSIR